MTSWQERGDVIDSPAPSVAEHVRRYLATDGQSGYMEGGMTNLLLTTVGRRSGKRHRTGLFYGDDHGTYILVASHFNGGPRHPNWYLNLVTHPEVQVQVQAETFTAVARTAEGDERTRLWQLMTSRVPAYDIYQARSSREIPVIVLERT